MNYIIGWTLNKDDEDVEVDRTGPLDLPDLLREIKQTLESGTDCTSFVVTIVPQRA